MAIGSTFTFKWEAVLRVALIISAYPLHKKKCTMLLLPDLSVIKAFPPSALKKVQLHCLPRNGGKTWRIKSSQSTVSWKCISMFCTAAGSLCGGREKISVQQSDLQLSQRWLEDAGGEQRGESCSHRLQRKREIQKRRVWEKAAGLQRKDFQTQERSRRAVKVGMSSEKREQSVWSLRSY